MEKNNKNSAYADKLIQELKEKYERDIIEEGDMGKTDPEVLAKLQEVLDNAEGRDK